MQNDITPGVSNKLANMGFVCSCLVVSIHVPFEWTSSSVGWWACALFDWGLARIAVPFFFAASGFFLAGHMEQPGWYGREIRKRIVTLLVPYLLWCVLYQFCLAPVSLAGNILAGRPLMQNIIPEGYRWLLLCFGVLPNKYPHLYTLWFVRTLCFFIVISSVLRRLVLFRRRAGGIFCLLFVLASLVTAPFRYKVGAIGLGVLWLFSFYNLAWFALGILLRMKGGALLERRYSNLAAAVLLILASMASIGAILMGMRTMTGAGSMAAAIRSLLVIPCGVLACWRLIPAIKWPRWLTGTAFPIYLLHPFFLTWMDFVEKHMPALGWMSKTAAGFMVYWLLAILGSIAMAVALRRGMPKVASVLFGGR